MIPKKEQRLNVFLNSVHIGFLDSKKGNQLFFSYTQHWLNDQNSFPISRGLPLTELIYDGPDVFNYFDNLLPDHISVRQKIAANAGAASDGVFDLLVTLGKDCVGALQFISDGKTVPELKTAAGIFISDSDIADKIQNLRSAPLALSFENDFRLSLAGTQEKSAFLKLKNKWHVPIGSTATTHIFKPQMSNLQSDFLFKNSVENEWLCNQILNGFGLPTAKSEICNFEDTTVLVVERFDRVQKNQIIFRIQQEDMCQALKIPGFKKYESQGGPNISQIMNLLFESTQSEQDRKNFIKTQILFYLLAAIDGHGKNFSLQWGASGFLLAPLYDVLSADALVENKKNQFKKIKMAMAVGDNKHYKLNEILPRHFQQTAKKCRFSDKDLKICVDEILSQIKTVVESVENNMPKKFPDNVADYIFKGLKKRSEKFNLA